MQTIIDSIQKFVDGFVELLKMFGYWLLDNMIDLLQSLANYFVNLFCNVVEWFFLLIDFKESMFDASMAWLSMPDSMIYILNKTGFDNGIAIITTAILIRLIMNLIPTWATRV